MSEPFEAQGRLKSVLPTATPRRQERFFASLRMTGGAVDAAYAPATPGTRLGSHWNFRLRWWYKAAPNGRLYPGQEGSPRVKQKL